MSHAMPAIEYASAPGGMCPLCTTRVVSNKTLYNHPVCKKCYYAFANRRQGAYVIDTLLQMLVAIPLALGVGGMLEFVQAPELVFEGVMLSFGLVLGVIVAMKDGFNGYSPGKWLLGVQVWDDASGRPIQWVQSFKRNAVFLTSQIPVVGSLVVLVLVIIIAVTLGRGHRLGDRFARTRVIWKRHANSIVFLGDERHAFPVVVHEPIAEAGEAPRA